MHSALASPPSAELLAQWEPVIGLEVHVQLSTRTKIFCGCPTSFGAPPNTNVCPVCLGLPGALPVMSRPAVEMAIRASLALHCRINSFSRMARKNYFYPDLPKGYQISQYDQPLASDGYLDVVTESGLAKRIGITRVHMEDDAGKSIHDGFRDSEKYSYVDLNRSGTPLIEIVSEPDMRSSEEAYAYLTDIKQVLQFMDVSTCDMEKGHLRCDANVSVRRRGTEKFGTKAEVKNLNSFRFLRLALDYEISRQVALIEGGGTVRQETRLYNPDSGETVSMRSKEQAHDYRYFPEPDLVPLRISDEWLANIKTTVPELPADMRERFVSQYGLREYDAQVLTATRAMSEYFEQVVGSAGNAVEAAKWVMGDLSGVLKAEGLDIADSPVSAGHLGELIALIAKGTLTGKLGKEVFAKMVQTREAPSVIVEREGLRAMGGGDELAAIVDQVIAASPKQVEQYRGGKTTVIGYLVGQVMKATKGQADPAAVNQLLQERLSS